MNLKFKTLLATLFVAVSTLSVSAQDITVAEPDTASADLVYWVTPANELKALPFETGEIKEHKNKFGKIASIVGGVADGIGGLGMLGSLAGVGGNSASAILTGVRVAGTAANVSSLADIGNSLAGAEGHDFTYKGSSSKLVVAPEGKDLKILVNLRCENKESGLSLLKVVRFKQTKSDRRLRWFQTKAALINTDKADDADKAGYLSFGFENYGEHCSLLTIPASELEKGEYGVYFLGNMLGPNMAILCYTFSVQ